MDSIIHNLDKVDWLHISEVRIYGSERHKRYTIEYIVLTTKDCKRFSRFYPSLPENFQVMDMIDHGSSTTSRILYRPVVGAILIYSRSESFFMRLQYDKCVNGGNVCVAVTDY